MKPQPMSQAFRYAIHGWAFCDAKMLVGKIRQAESLAHNDEEKAQLARIKQALEEMEASE